MGIVEIAKNLGVYQNVTLNVIDINTGEVVQTHSGHNMATNSLIYGIAHYLTGDGILGQGTSMLSSYVPQYISVGTMGLKSQTPKNGLPDIDSSYVNEFPGYGSDGYDLNDMNNRNQYGLGRAFTSYSDKLTYKSGDKVTISGYEYICNSDINMPMPYDKSYWTKGDKIPDVGIELIDPVRFDISFRDIEPETKAELPRTMDVIFSTMISTGVLSKYRGNRDFIYITEVGLWSKKLFVDVETVGGTNGLLAGYRLMPKNSDDWGNTTKVKQSILRVGKNQVVQVVWKIQLGSMTDLLVDSKLEQLKDFLRGKSDDEQVTVGRIKDVIKEGKVL